MRKRWAAVAALGVLGTAGAVLVSSLDLGRRSGPEQRDQKSNVVTSYALGVEMARNARRLSEDLDVDAANQGFTDFMSGRKLRMTEREVVDAMSAVWRGQSSRRAQAKRADAGQRSRQDREFLQRNAKRKGVVTLPSGLQYEILQAGHGTTPTDADTVECQYRATLADGTQFGDSRARGQPATVQVAKAIPGLREALKLMPTGSRWRIFVPPELAYAERRAGARSGASTAVVFDLDLLSVKAAGTTEQ